ncbi:MAG: hypothetical protein WBC63_05555, partial [Candidatus Bipolaricaulia bacterium]
MSTRNTESLTLTFQIYLRNIAGIWVVQPTLDHSVAGTNQHVRVDIMDPSAGAFDVGAGVLRNLYVSSSGDPLESGYTLLSFDLMDFAGQTVRLRFAEVADSFHILMGIDDVQFAAIYSIRAMQVVPMGYAGTFLDRDLPIGGGGATGGQLTVVGYRSLQAVYEIGETIIGDWL